MKHNLDLIKIIANLKNIIQLNNLTSLLIQNLFKFLNYINGEFLLNFVLTYQLLIQYKN